MTPASHDRPTVAVENPFIADVATSGIVAAVACTGGHGQRVCGQSVRHVIDPTDVSAELGDSDLTQRVVRHEPESH